MASRAQHEAKPSVGGSKPTRSSGDAQDSGSLGCSMPKNGFGSWSPSATASAIKYETLTLHLCRWPPVHWGLSSQNPTGSTLFFPSKAEVVQEAGTLIVRRSCTVVRPTRHTVGQTWPGFLGTRMYCRPGGFLVCLHIHSAHRSAEAPKISYEGPRTNEEPTPWTSARFCAPSIPSHS